MANSNSAGWFEVTALRSVQQVGKQQLYEFESAERIIKESESDIVPPIFGKIELLLNLSRFCSVVFRSWVDIILQG